jgi:hypothetical protein
MAALQWRVALDLGTFRRLAAHSPITFTFNNGAAEVEIVVGENVGGLQMLRAVLDGMTPGQPKGPPDPIQAREFLPNRYTRRDE